MPDFPKFAFLNGTSAGGRVAGDLLRPFFRRLMCGEDLSEPEAADLMRILLEEKPLNVEQTVTVLAALAAKGETADELTGMASALRERAVEFPVRKQKFADIGGTVAPKFFDAPIAASFVIAGAGLAVAKQCGFTAQNEINEPEILAALGVDLKTGGAPRTLELARKTVEGAEICFLPVSDFHPQLADFAVVRTKLGANNIFDLLSALANPARPPFQILGVRTRNLLAPVAEALSRLGAERAWAVHGADNADELSITGETYVAEAQNNTLKTFTITPEDFRIRSGSLAELPLGTSADAAQIINEILDGTRRDAARNAVVLNAAAALYISGIARNQIHAARLAEQSIDSDAARRKLDRLKTAARI